MIIQYIEQRYQMEDENKELYFRYYQSRTPTADSYGRKKQPYKRYNNSKILPHITEEYNYRITNYLLIKKIINPKRDKTIMQSLEGLSRKYHSTHGKLNSVSRDHFRRKTKLKSYQNSRLEQPGSAFDYGLKEQPRAKTALRQGKIARRNLQKRKTETEFQETSGLTVNKGQNELNQTSPSQYRTQNTYLSKDSKEDRIFMSSQGFNKKWKQNYPLHGRCFKNHPTGYGNGPTVLLLTHLEIEINPSIKPQALIQLQLIERASFTRQYLNVSCENNEKTVKADPFKYCELPKQGDSSSSIKFCIRLCKIGDFVPLRIWKYCGVQSILVGTIDLPLNSFTQQENKQSKKIELVHKKDNELMFKRIFHGQVQHNLSKNKMIQTDSVAVVKYKVYPKRFYHRQDKVIKNQ